MADEDEIDYMSEEFLLGCIEKNDVRPGLIHSHSSKRKHKMEKKKQNSDETYRKKMRPVHEIQKEKLKEGLETPLDSSNKGYALLKKMGYKAGMSLGKQGTGIVEPVSLVLKSDRIGLGWEELLREKKRKIEERKKEKIQMDPLEYRAHMSKQHNQKLIDADLRKSRQACYNLDFKEGILNPHEYWFWPEHTWESEEEAQDEDEDEDDNDQPTAEDDHPESFIDDLEPSDQLQILTSYLRSTYLYCIWCCTDYEDAEDLEKNCPGPSRFDHD